MPEQSPLSSGQPRPLTAPIHGGSHSSPVKRKRVLTPEQAHKKREYERRWREKNREKLREGYRKHYRESRDKVLAHQRESRASRSEEQKAVVRERHRGYREINRGRLLAQKKAYYQKNKKRHRERAAHWASLNPEKMRAYRLLWARSNPEKLQKSRVRWEKENPAVCLERVRRRQARLRGCSLVGSRRLVQTIYEASLRVTSCVGVRFEVDHIVPLSKGGDHSPGNLQILPRWLNGRKGAKLEFEEANILFDRLKQPA